MHVPRSTFRECRVEADAFTISYFQAGAGRPLVYLHAAGGLDVTEALGLLAHRFHVLALEMPGFGQSPTNARTNSLAELANTMAAAVRVPRALCTPGAAAAAVYARSRSCREQLALTRRISGPAWDEDLEQRLAHLRVPTLLVVGRRDGLFDPDVTARNYARVLPRHRLEVVEDAAHEIGSDQPELFARLVGDFVADTTAS